MYNGPMNDLKPTFPLLAHLRRDLIEAAYAAAAGNEIASGKMSSPESSSALVANAFGLFIDRPQVMPPIPGLADAGWPAVHVALERQLRFPWSGGRHPWLDVWIETQTHIIGIESKRYEPFRGAHTPNFSEVFWRDVWAPSMQPFLAVRDALRAGDAALTAIDAAQLVKHALALSAEASRREDRKKPVLIYLHANPSLWPNGKLVAAAQTHAHEAAIHRFTAAVAGAQVTFMSLTYSELCDSWLAAEDPLLRQHATSLQAAFHIQAGKSEGA